MLFSLAWTDLINYHTTWRRYFCVFQEQKYRYPKRLNDKWGQQ